MHKHLVIFFYFFEYLLKPEREEPLARPPPPKKRCKYIFWCGIFTNFTVADYVYGTL